MLTSVHNKQYKDLIIHYYANMLQLSLTVNLDSSWQCALVIIIMRCRHCHLQTLSLSSFVTLKCGPTVLCKLSIRWQYVVVCWKWKLVQSRKNNSTVKMRHVCDGLNGVTLDALGNVLNKQLMVNTVKSSTSYTFTLITNFITN